MTGVLLVRDLQLVAIQPESFFFAPGVGPLGVIGTLCRRFEDHTGPDGTGKKAPATILSRIASCPVTLDEKTLHQVPRHFELLLLFRNPVTGEAAGIIEVRLRS